MDDSEDTDVSVEDAKVVEVGGFKKVFVADVTLSNLKWWVSVELAKLERSHRAAARAAGVSASYWSKVLHRRRIREADLKILARGLDTTPERIVEETTARAE